MTTNKKKETTPTAAKATPRKNASAKTGSTAKKTAPLGKHALAREMATKLDVSIAQAEQFLTVYMETVTENLAKGTPIALIGFGTFEVRQRAARSGRNPQTGEEIQIAASRAVGFKVGAQLKKVVA